MVLFAAPRLSADVKAQVRACSEAVPRGDVLEQPWEDSGPAPPWVKLVGAHRAVGVKRSLEESEAFARLAS